MQTRQQQRDDLRMSVRELVHGLAYLQIKKREHRIGQIEAGRPANALQIAALLGKKLDPWQRDVLEATEHDILLLVTRQGGKGEITTLMALDMLINQPGSTQLIVSRAERQANRLLRRVQRYYAQLPNVPQVISSSVGRLELDNGSEIIAVPGSEETIRGIDHVHRILCDEAGLVPDDLFAALYPMLATTDGQFVGMTSARGKRGWFYREWTEGGPDWHRKRVTWEEIPPERLSRSYIERTRRRLGEFMFRQEFGCEFMDDVTQMFASDLIRQAIVQAPPGRKLPRIGAAT